MDERGINPAWMSLGKGLGGKRHFQTWAHPVEWHIQGAARGALTGQENPKMGGKWEKSIWRPKGWEWLGFCGIQRLIPAPLGISAAWEGIVMSHPPAKVPAGRKGGPSREISKHGNVYLEFGPKERFCKIQREDWLGMKPAGYWISPEIQGKKKRDCCKAQSTRD